MDLQRFRGEGRRLVADSLEQALNKGFDELDGFDTAFAKDFNDVDFCLRARAAGYRVAWTPYAHLTHHEGASIVRKKPDPAEHDLFGQRWAGATLDPYYSPALNEQLARIYEPN
jgi:GT2 family glycosyltransferase